MEIPLSSAVNAAKTTLWQSNEAIYLKLDVYEVDNIANFGVCWENWKWILTGVSNIPVFTINKSVRFCQI